MDDGWAESAAAWLDEQGEDGDYGRVHVLDGPMLARIRGRGFRRALDVGCGEGRLCRMMAAEGIATVGIDPTKALLDRARALDPAGDYRLERAETMILAPGSFDLVVSYLSLIDIPDLAPALARMTTALAPGGTLLVANLNGFSTAGGWVTGPDGETRFCVDRYLDERPQWSAWRGIRIRNWHRPLATYMGLLLDHGLLLRIFAEPAPTGGDPAKADRYRRVPYFHIMEWQKPGG